MAALTLGESPLYSHTKYIHFKGETNATGYVKTLRNYKLLLKVLYPLIKYKINLQ